MAQLLRGKTQSDVKDVSGSSGSGDDFYDRDDKHYPLRGFRRLVVANKMQYIFYWADDTKSYHRVPAALTETILAPAYFPPERLNRHEFLHLLFSLQW